jgi:hypothetical protein
MYFSTKGLYDQYLLGDFLSSIWVISEGEDVFWGVAILETENS